LQDHFKANRCPGTLPELHADTYIGTREGFKTRCRTKPRSTIQERRFASADGKFSDFLKASVYFLENFPFH
jgi:hypothetical protein